MKQTLITLTLLVGLLVLYGHSCDGTARILGRDINMNGIPAEQKVGNLIVIHTPGIEMMGISREGLVTREFVEEVKRLDGESITDWHARAVTRAEELQK